MNPTLGLYKCVSTGTQKVITVQSVAGKQYGLVNFYESTNDLISQKGYVDKEYTFQDTLDYSELCELFSSFVTYS